MRDQQSQFINLVYDNKEVFSLHDEDLGYCDLIKHTNLTMTEEACILAALYYPQTTPGESAKMSGYLVVPGYYKTIQKPICIPGGNSVQEVRGNSSLH